MKKYSILNLYAVIVSAVTLLFVIQTAQTVLATAKLTIASTNSTMAHSNFSSLSPDGNYVTFVSNLALTSDDTNGTIDDIYIRDRGRTALRLVSTNCAGNAFSNGSNFPSIGVSGNLLRVAFHVDVTNKIIVKEYSLPGLTQTNCFDSTSGIAASGANPKVSANGAYLVYDSSSDIYRYQFSNAVTVIVTCTWMPCSTGATRANYYPAISSNGNYIVYQSTTNYLPTNRTDIFIFDYSLGVTELISVAPNGDLGHGNSGFNGDTSNYVADVSDNGNLVVFTSIADNFTDNDNNNQWDVFLRNRSANRTDFIGTKDSGGTVVKKSGNANMSKDGRFITFTRSNTELMLYDTLVGLLRALDTVSSATISAPEISQGGQNANGRCISYSRQDPTGAYQTYVYDRISLAQRNPGDFDGDGATDLAVFRPSNTTWYYAPSSNPTTTGSKVLGASTDKIASNDYDGDGATDIAVFTPSTGTWSIFQSSTSTLNTVANIVTGGSTTGDIPVPADYDGDNKADLAVFRPSNGTWYVKQSSSATGVVIATVYGASTDIPAPGDYDRDGKADIAVFRPSTGTWYLNRSTAGTLGVAFGASGDIPVAADYDGDTQSEIAVFRPSNGTWYIYNLVTATSSGVAFGQSGDKPVPGDYDNDGKTDVAVFRPATGSASANWYLQPTYLNFTAIAFGAAGDIPIPYSN